MVWSHFTKYGVCESMGFFSRTVWGFHMPLFAILSGYFFSIKRNPKEFIVTKSKQLLLPLVTWSIIMEVIIHGCIDVWNYLHGGDSIHFFAIARNVIFSIIDYRLWFLRALFLCFVYGYFFIKYSSLSIVKSSVLSVLLLQTISLLGIIPNRQTFLIGFIFLYPFFIVGFLLKEKADFISKYQSRILFAFALVFCAIRPFWHGNIDCFYDMNTSIFAQEGAHNVFGLIVIRKVVIRFIMGTSTSIILFILAKMLYEKKQNLDMVSSYMSKVGKYTLSIYALHYLFYEFVPEHQLFKNDISVWLYVCGLSLTVVLISFYICKITEKNKYLNLLLWGK